MTSILLQFPPPPRRSNVTAMEQEGLFKDVPERIPFSCVPDYPDVQIQNEITARSGLHRESAQLAFLTHDQSIWRKALYAWYEGGITNVFEELMDSKGEVPSWMCSVCEKAFKTLVWMKSLRLTLFPQTMMSNEDMLSKYSHVSNWKKSPVQAFAWHPHVTKLALALHDDSVRVYYSGSGISPVLKHKLQKHVADLAWQPLSAMVLAVACENCILIWHVEPTSLAVRPSSSTVQVLQASGHSPITSVSWSPDSSHLVSASPRDASILVWDVPCETGTALKRDRGAGVNLLAYSPDGSKLFTGSPSSFFRVWETKKWNCEVWSQLSGPITAASWSPDGTVLLFAMEGESSLFAVRFNQDLMQEHNISAVGTSVLIADLSPVDVATGSDESIRVGGAVKTIAWDKTGERVAILFEANEYGNNTLVAILKVTIHPVLELLPGGFVKGMSGESAHHVAFQPNFPNGALLSVVWSSGRIGYIPLYFVPAEEISRHRSALRFSPLSPIKSPRNGFNLSRN